MKLNFYQIVLLLGIVVGFFLLPEQIHAKAEEEISIMQVEGKKYLFDKKDEYIFLDSHLKGSTSDSDTLGNFCIKGKIQETEQAGMKIPAYQANENEMITFIYQPDTKN